MKKYILLVSVLVFLLTAACATPPFATPTPTPEPWVYSLDVYAYFCYDTNVQGDPSVWTELGTYAGGIARPPQLYDRFTSSFCYYFISPFWEESDVKSFLEGRSSLELYGNWEKIQASEQASRGCNDFSFHGTLRQGLVPRVPEQLSLCVRQGHVWKAEIYGWKESKEELSTHLIVPLDWDKEKALEWLEFNFPPQSWMMEKESCNPECLFCVSLTKK